MQTPPSAASPPDFDFNSPCRYFKSSFARSLSLHHSNNNSNGSGGGCGSIKGGFNGIFSLASSDNHCKSLDFDIGQYRSSSNNNGQTIAAFCGSNNNLNIVDTKNECPPLPQRNNKNGATIINTTINTNSNASNNNNNKSRNSNSNGKYLNSAVDSDDADLPPAIPARYPIVASKSAGMLSRPTLQQQQQHHQQQQQQHLPVAQLRHTKPANTHGHGHGCSNGNVAAAAVAAATHGNFNRPINHTGTQQTQQQQQQQSLQQQQVNSSSNTNGNDATNTGNSRLRNRCSNIRRNIWPTDRNALLQQQHQHQQKQQDTNLCAAIDGIDVADTDDDDDDGGDNDDGDDDIDVAHGERNNGNNATTSCAATQLYATAGALRATKTAAPIFKAPPPPPPQSLHHENAMNVEVVVLQNQVDTLQWQLKQVETSCVMYRAVIEEVARFLERYQSQKHQQRQLQQNRIGNEQISRSKSLYQVCGIANISNDSLDHKPNGVMANKANNTANETPNACLRARSSGNLVELKQGNVKTAGNGSIALPFLNTKHATLAVDKRATTTHNSYDAMNGTTTATTFKDFTWRRTPKKYAECKAQAAADDDEEKLNQEAFRLSRTIHNLLNTSTQQPDLTQHRQMLTTRAKTMPKLTLPAANATEAAQRHAAANATATAQPLAAATTTLNVNVNNNANANANANANTNTNTTSEMLFLRATNMRDSRLSLRSSTDSSVHSSTSTSSAASSASSTSSSKHDTDDDHVPSASYRGGNSDAYISISHKPSPLLLHQPHGSATEDESGFSSISSFQDIGVPFHSTMISPGSCSNTPCRLSLASNSSSSKREEQLVSAAATAEGTINAAAVELNHECLGDSRNSTLKAAAHPSNVLGVPLQATYDMQHRWDQSPRTLSSAASVNNTAATAKTTYRNMSKFQQRFSTLSSEEAAAVLWV